MTKRAGGRPGRQTLVVGRRFAATALGVWVACLLVVDFRLTGSAARQPAAVALTAAVATAVVLVVTWPAGRLLRKAAVKAQRGMAREPDWNASEWEFFAPMRRYMVIMTLSILLQLVADTVVFLLGLWAGVRLSAEAGLPVELSGQAPTVVAGVVAGAVASAALAVFGLFLKRSAAAARGALAGVVLGVAGVALAAWLLDGVRLGAAPLWQQVLLLVAVVCVMRLAPRFTLTLPVPGLASLVLVSIRALVLWAVLQAVPFMEPRLYVDGFWPLVGVAAFVWVVEWPTRLAEARGEAATRQPEPIDPFPPGHMFPQGPYY
ncbi:hypothetical protein ACFPM3_04585 [Streptomyces coeruleoprunus]|uniref:Uncharacterized protein n=1 Tax=Streptomyces coeruleoprunus TaxID=285563 RepID=A0ABV9X8T8_9ACTN